MMYLGFSCSDFAFCICQSFTSMYGIYSVRHSSTRCQEVVGKSSLPKTNLLFFFCQHLFCSNVTVHLKANYGKLCISMKSLIMQETHSKMCLRVCARYLVAWVTTPFTSPHQLQESETLSRYWYSSNSSAGARRP